MLKLKLVSAPGVVGIPSPPNVGEDPSARVSVPQLDIGSTGVARPAVAVIPNNTVLAKTVLNIS